MTTYYVDGKSGNDSNNGSSGSPWKTLAKAKRTIKAGDEVRLRTASYHEQLTIDIANTTWSADTGHKPVLDGGYGPHLMYKSGGLDTMPPPGPNHLPGGQWGNMILVRANGVLVDGLTIQNCAGAGVGMAAVSDVVIRNCRIDFTYLNNMHVTGGSGWGERIIFENNVLTRGSVRKLVPGVGTWGGAIAIGKARDCIVRNNLIGFIWGEGIDPHRGAIRTTVEGNVIHSCMSTHIYIQRAKDNVIRNNIIYHTGMPEFLWRSSQRVSEGIMIADESASSAFPYSSGDQIYNNIVIGMGILLNIGNGSPLQDTQLNKSYIGYNTFIGGPQTRVGIAIPDNTTSPNRTHVNSIFENNIICNVPSDKPIARVGNRIGGLLFRNNLWDRQPPAQARGNGDRIGTPVLVNPTANFTNPYPEPTATIDPRNYQLTSNSNLAIGMASNGSAANGLTPPPIKKDFFGANRDNSPDIGAHEYLGVSIELTANFSIGPGQGAGPLPHTVDFVDKTTSTEPIASRLWDFGDGETSTETNPSHTYTTAGTFDVSLTVTDRAGNTSTAKQAGLISVSEVPSTILPDSFRRFVLMQREGHVVLAYGTQYPDMRCILLWSNDPFHILNFDNIRDVEESNLSSGTIEILWIDAGEQVEPPTVEPISGSTELMPSRMLG